MLLVSFLRPVVRLGAKIRGVLLSIQKRIGDRSAVPEHRVSFLRQLINLFIQRLDLFVGFGTGLLEFSFILRAKFLELCGILRAKLLEFSGILRAKFLKFFRALRAKRFEFFFTLRAKLFELPLEGFLRFLRSFLQVLQFLVRLALKI